MKIALLVVLGLLLGALGGAALGIGAGLAWVEIFNTSSFEGYSGMLVFFTFMPLGATIGGLGLTGLIRTARLQLRRVPGVWIAGDSQRFPNLDAFFELAENSDAEYEYTVAWLDCANVRSKLGRRHK